MDKIINNFKFVETNIKDLYLIETKKYGDNRGYFVETYKESDFMEAGLNYKFVQDNQSRSKCNVLRGLHFQKNYSQAKLVRVIEGEIYDVAVDLRDGSITYGMWYGVTLSSDKCNMLMIPRGFAHGFLVLSDYATISYKCDELYHPEDECGIIWNDKDININWPNNSNLIISDKDNKLLSFKELNYKYKK